MNFSLDLFLLWLINSFIDFFFKKLISEIKIHKSLQNSGIVNFEHVFEDQEYVYILLELCSNQVFFHEFYS